MDLFSKLNIQNTRFFFTNPNIRSYKIEKAGKAKRIIF